MCSQFSPLDVTTMEMEIVRIEVRALPPDLAELMEGAISSFYTAIWFALFGAPPLGMESAVATLAAGDWQADVGTDVGRLGLAAELLGRVRIDAMTQAWGEADMDVLVHVRA